MARPKRAAILVRRMAFRTPDLVRSIMLWIFADGAGRPNLDFAVSPEMLNATIPRKVNYS